MTSGQVRGQSSAKSPSQPAPGQLTRGAKAGGKKPGRAGSAIPVQRQHPETRSEGTRQKQPQRRKKCQGGTAGADGRLGVGVRSRDADTTEVPVAVGDRGQGHRRYSRTHAPRGGGEEKGLGVREVSDRGQGALRH